MLSSNAELDVTGCNSPWYHFLLHHCHYVPTYLLWYCQ